MFRLFTLCALGLVVAAGGPILYYTAADYFKGARDKWFPASETATEEVADPAATSDEQSGTNSGVGPAGLALEGAPTRDLGEVIRFDVTIDWILRRWPRVSTGLSQLQLQGYRVPLVTGTAKTDLAGSLTYYFNAKQQVQRITFRGTTGNARDLIRLLTTRYRFARRLTNDPGLFIYEVGSPDGRPRSVLKITSAPVVEASRPYQQFDVHLVMQRAS